MIGLSSSTEVGLERIGTAEGHPGDALSPIFTIRDELISIDRF
jgi:hypothetical protein